MFAQLLKNVHCPWWYGNDFQAEFYITIWIQFDSFYYEQKKINVYSPHTQSHSVAHSENEKRKRDYQFKKRI